MKKIGALVFALSFIFIPLVMVRAMDNELGREDRVDIPPGMEAKPINQDVTIVMPEGAKMYKRNQTTFVLESAEEYSARKFVDVNEKLTKLGAEVDALNKSLAGIKAKLDEALAAQQRSLPKKAGAE